MAITNNLQRPRQDSDIRSATRAPNLTKKVKMCEQKSVNWIQPIRIQDNKSKSQSGARESGDAIGPNGCVTYTHLDQSQAWKVGQTVHLLPFWLVV